MENEFIQPLLVYRNKGVDVVVIQSDGSKAYSGRVAEIVGCNVLFNRLSETEICCGGKRKRRREVLPLDRISKVENNTIYLK